MAIVRVFDDGADSAETIRVRADQFVVGRTEGDLVIPHDNGMSSRHFELCRLLEDGEYRWCVRDLDSTNGTFANVADSQLKHNKELLIGSRRYRFDAAPQGASSMGTVEDPGAPQRNVTQPWQAVDPSSISQLVPGLVELTPSGEGNRLPLAEREQYLGSDTGRCSALIQDDPFVEPCHCRVYRDARDRWRIENKSSMNGIWLRIEQIRVEQSGNFQAGEQRFSVRVL